MFLKKTEKLAVMEWKEAVQLLISNIQRDLHLTPNVNFKIVREVPPYRCKNYNNSEGFRVQVGTTSFVNIPLEMLQTIFEASIQNKNTYKRAVFKEFFPRELNTKPCNVHSVGKLFEHAGIMEMVDKRTYRII